MSKSSEFGDLTDSLIKDRLVCGVIKDSVQSRLLRETELTLQKAIDVCRAAETSSQQMKVIQSSSSGVTGGNVDVVNRKIVKSKSLKNTDNKPAGSTRKQKCRKCGYNHEPRKCLAFGKLCHNCKKKNHFSTVCKNKKTHELQVNDYGSDIFLDSVETDQNVKECNNVINSQHET